jgi:hypothetical protein
MSQRPISRRDFLKLASLSLISIAARPALLRRGPQQPGDCALPASDGNPLSAEQRQRLYDASLRFLAPDPESANQVALGIDFIEGNNEHASTMCGPLTISILQAAGLLGAWVNPHDFWLMNPRLTPRPIEDTFPSDLYYNYSFASPISKFDFSTLPLLTGDIVYLHAGSGDTYEHVFVVNRVDEGGRPYTVSNFFTATGTIIEERMLYDPQVPGKGQIAAWADRAVRNTLGITGSGGFRIWRVKDGRTLEFPAEAANLHSSLDELLLASPAEWYASIKQINGPLLYQFNPYAAFHPASTIKVPVAMAFYLWLAAEGPEDWESYIAEHGRQGRSYAQLLEALLVNSEEDATEILVDFLGKQNLQDLWQGWGLKKTQIDPRRTSATEISFLFEKLYLGRWLKPEHHAHLMGLLSTYTANDDTRIGLLRPRLPDGTVIYNKRGSLVDWPKVVGDSAIIQLPGFDGAKYIFTLHGLGKEVASYEHLEETVDAAVQLFGDFLLNK